MRFITADYIFPVSSQPVKNGVVVVEDDGVIREVLLPEIFSRQSSIYNRQFPGHRLETFRGIICPGFINAHCHLELSHLKGKITPGKGLPHFIREIATIRKSSETEIAEAIEKAEDEMIKAGVVAIGDISNFNHSFKQKLKRRLMYHTFIELFDLVPERAEEEFQKGLNLMKELANANEGSDAECEPENSISIAPHAPYTVSSKLLNLIGDYSVLHDSLLTIHNQETESEHEMFLDGKGKLFDTLSSFGDYYKNWKPKGSGSLSYTLANLPENIRILLVHNTFTSAEDFAFSQLQRKMIWWCTCPNANLFIENRLPDYALFLEAGCRMTVGTDSYASNTSLSILDELKTISKHAAYIPLEILLQWSTLNGAEFLRVDQKLGSLVKGKKPGMNLITNVDSDTLRLTENSTVEKII